MRKQSRKLKALGIMPKGTKKEMGIPNLFPHKQALINQLEAKDRADEEKLEKLKASIKGQKSAQSMEDYLEVVQGKQHKYEEEEKFAREEEKEFENSAELKAKASSKRAYLRDLKEVIDQSDVILEVLDARDPMACRNIEMEHRIMSANKQLVFVLNKIDLVSGDNSEQWQKKLKNEKPTILFKATTQSQKDNLANKISLHKNSSTNRPEMTESMLNSSKAVGTEDLLSALKNYCRFDSSRKNKKQIIVGVIGFPNVGKSSLINSLKRSRAAATGNMPGHTKGIQEIQLDKDIVLLDCPGVVQSKEGIDSLILRNVVKIEQISDPIKPVEALLNKVESSELCKLYRIQEFSTTQEFLAAVCRKRGKLGKGGVPELDAAATIVLRDWNNGRIRYETPVPEGDDLMEEAQTIVGANMED